MKRLMIIAGLAALCSWAAPSPAASILDLQANARTSEIRIESSEGARGFAKLIELNPSINSWYVLEIRWDGARDALAYHLENPAPKSVKLSLDAKDLLRLDRSGAHEECDLWWSGPATVLERARRSAMPFAPLCDSQLYLRNVTAGNYTQLERTTNLLRDHLWGGDRIIDFVKGRFYRDAYAEKAEDADASRAPQASASASPRTPRAARVDDANAVAVTPEHLGLDIGNAASLRLGEWYEVRGTTGIFVSAMRPIAIASEVLRGERSRVNALDNIEASALDYLVAFDLSQFELGFVLGTDHPRLGWSDRVPDSVRAATLGPDGIDSSSPLVRVGMVDPAHTTRVAATFTGGFKREHGAFHRGELALRNAGSHYGFIEHGTIFSRLQPGLATVMVLDDGAVSLRTWSRADESLLPRIQHARQNGAPLIEPDPVSSIAAPGTLVNQWGPGNWSGSADENLRTLRAGLCLQRTPTRTFLIYGYFSTATPSAMVRVFQSYGCDYAMHLDMNALEHTYLAVYAHAGRDVLVQHLIQGMAVVDRKVRDAISPRFIAYPDNRDFFYLTRR